MPLLAWSVSGRTKWTAIRAFGTISVQATSGTLVPYVEEVYSDDERLGMWGMFGMVLLYVLVFWATLGVLVVWAVKQFTTHGVPRSAPRGPDATTDRSPR